MLRVWMTTLLLFSAPQTFYAAFMMTSVTSTALLFSFTFRYLTFRLPALLFITSHSIAICPLNQ